MHVPFVSFCPHISLLLENPGFHAWKYQVQHSLSLVNVAQAVCTAYKWGGGRLKTFAFRLIESRIWILPRESLIFGDNRKITEGWL